MASATGAIEERAVALLTDHARRYPAWCARDAYKLVYQACMGPGHAVLDIPAAEHALLWEWNKQGPSPGGPLLEPIGLSTPLWRLHLATANAEGIHPSAVLEAFLDCVRSFPPRPDLLAVAWPIVVRAIRGGLIAVTDPAELSPLDAEVHARGFPAVSHSGVFRETYAPAYRLVGTPDLASPSAAPPGREGQLFSY